MLVIDQRTYNALEADLERRNFVAFINWWRSRRLPPGNADYLRQMWDYASVRAKEIGIESDERGQISLYAAAFGLIGQLDEEQFLLIADILFLNEAVDVRLSHIAEVARGHLP